MSEKSEILKYIVHTPENTNPAIVKSMLDNYEKPTNTVTMPVYGANRSDHSLSLLTTYSGAPGIIIGVPLPDNTEEVAGVFVANISAQTGGGRQIPYRVVFDALNKRVIITTLDPATVDPTYDSVVITYTVGE